MKRTKKLLAFVLAGAMIASNVAYASPSGDAENANTEVVDTLSLNPNENEGGAESSGSTEAADPGTGGNVEATEPAAEPEQTAPMLYEVTFESPEKHGDILKMDDVVVEEGEKLEADENGNVQFKVKADSGYRVEKVVNTANGEELELVENLYYELQISENTTIQVHYQKIPAEEDADSDDQEDDSTAAEETADEEAAKAEMPEQTAMVRALNLLAEGTVSVQIVSDGEIIKTISIPQGNIGEETYTMSGYQFLYAQTSGGTRLDYVGTYNGQTYYATISGEEGYYQQATLLTEGETIQLVYEEIGYPISLSKTGNGASVEGNSVDCPQYSTLNKGFNIEVTTARGYEATVTVNGNKISSDSKVYSVSNEQARPGIDGNINVNVEFSKVNTYKAWVENTGLENYHGASWSSIGRSESSPQTFSAGGPYTFYVTMPYDGNDWRFNSLQINGEYVKVPTSYSKGATSEDTLSTGTAVSITLNEVPTTTYDWWGRPTTNGNYKYKITLTNVYEDIVITGGNFRANSWQEIMPNTIEGVELEVNDRQDNRGWTSVEEAVPMGYNSQGNGSYIEFRYKILPGYGNIKVNVTDGTLSSITQQNGYYKFTVTKSSAGCTVLNITATALTYSVKYTAGSGSDVSNLPTNTNSYSISGAAGTYSDIFVANEIPTAAGKIFNGWKIGENTYWPGDTVQLEDIAEYSNNNNELVFEAQWVDEGTSPDRYTYEIKVYKQNPQDPINYDLVENACETKTAQTGQPITIINRPDAAPDAGDTYEGYHLNEAKSHLTITGNDDDKEISFYYDLDQFTITTSVENGTIDESSTVYYGKDVTVNYSPKNGYELVSVIVDGEDVTDDNPNSYNFNDVKGNHSISVKYVRDTSVFEGALTGYEGTYDGQPHFVTFDERKLVEGETVKYYVDDVEQTGNPQYTNVTNAEVTVKVVAADGTEVWSGTASVVINKRTLKVHTTDSKVYNGQDQTMEIKAEDLIEDTSLAEGDTLTVEASITGKEVKTYTELNEGATWIIKNESEEDVTGNYDISVTGAFTITKAGAAQYQGTVALEDWTYGEAANAEVASTTGGDYSDPTYEYKKAAAGDDAYSTTKPTDAGNYIVKATWEATDNCDEITATDTFTINKKAVIIKTNSAERVYNAIPLTATGNVDGIVEGETYEFTTTGSQTYVGESKNTYNMVWANGENGFTAKAENYNVTEQLGTLKVTDGDEKTPVDPDKVVVKKHTGPGEGSFKVGDVVTFDISVTNIYDKVKTITLSEVAGVTLSQSKFENVKPGEVVNTTATYTITEADVVAGEFVNTVTAEFSGEEKTYSNDDTVDELEEPNGHLTITKTTTSTPENGETYALGETIKYEITAANDGNLTLKNAVVIDDLTGDEWTIESLAPEASKTFEASYTVTEDDIHNGTVVNEATATAESDDPDNDPVVVPGTTEDETDAETPDLAIAKSIVTQKTEYQIGDTIEYQIKVTNTGNVTQNDIVVEDQLHAAGDIVITDVKGADGKINGAEVTLDTLAPGEAATISCEYTVLKEDRGSTITNVAIADDDDGENPSTPEVPAEVEEVYDINVTHVFADGEEGNVTLPADYVIENLALGTSKDFTAEEVAGYTVYPAEQSVTVEDGDVTVVFTYYRDVIGTNPQNPDTPDGIPDIYQARVTYVAVNGVVSFQTAVVTLFDTNGQPAKNGIGHLTAAQIPTATAWIGYNQASASWGATGVPTTAFAITGDITFTVTFAANPATPAVTTVEEEATPLGDYELGELDDDDVATIDEDDTPLGNLDLDKDHACCILHFLLLLLALIIELIYTHNRKKGQERIFELRRQLAENEMMNQDSQA